MDRNNTFHVLNETQQVIEIRTRIMTQNPPLYVIQYPEPRRSPTDRIRYRSEFVNEKRFYM